MFYWLRWHVKRILARYTVIIESCQSCGATVNQVWRAPNELWVEVIGAPTGVRCVNCFDSESRAKGLSVYWHAKLEYRFQKP